ncbi:MAG: tripartite tricarboxylate transporter TctB family protein [Alphaproteobacteria bacterium]|nr:tripartite tricarboxylate transporter TctB family protein [Alphaproteobacteria bacterium]
MAGTSPGTRLASDIVGGLLLIGVAAVAHVALRDIDSGPTSSVGPAFMPNLVAGLIAAMGVLILILGLIPGGRRLEPWTLRGPILVLGAVVAFAATVRPLGLAVAGPLAMILAALADRETRPMEVMIFAAVMTGFCILLFKVALRLPIPLLPFILGY